MIALIALGTLATLCLIVSGVATLESGRQQRQALINRSALDLVEARASRLRSRLNVRLRRTGYGRWLQSRIDRSGVVVSVADLSLLLAGGALATYLLASRLVAPLFALILAAGAVRGGLAYLDRKQAQRRELFVSQLPEVARVLSNGASAGLALRSAIAMAGDDLAEPAGGELRQITDQMSLGVSVEDALLDLERRLPSRELSVLVRTLVIQARAGGAVVSALRGMAETLDARKELRREVRTVLSGSVLTSYIVLFIGVGALLMLNLITPGLLHTLTTQLPGQIALVVSISMFSFGYLLIRRVTKIEV